MKWVGKDPLKVFKVKSRLNRNPDTGDFIEYDVELWGDKKIFCNCLAGSFHRPCFHKQKVQQDLEKEFGSIEKAISFYRNKHK